MVSTCSTSTPSGVFRKEANASTNTLPTATSTSVTATCATRTARLARLCMPIVRVEADWNAVKSTLADESAGPSANTRNARPAAIEANVNARQSGATSSVNPGELARNIATSRRSHQWATRTPAAKATTSTIPLSTRTRRAICHRVAPRARRTAVSRRRLAARASSKLATLTAATSKTSAAIATSAVSGGPNRRRNV